MASTTENAKKPHVLLILDGWGHSETSTSNAIQQANTPTWNQLCENHPKTLISCSGEAVGLPKGQMGNSEVGHMTLGTGRVIYQDLSKINKAIKDESFYENPALTKAVDSASKAAGRVHIIGLMSDGGVHSHEDHIIAMLKTAAMKGAKEVYLHAFLDGRDTAPKHAEHSIRKLERAISETGIGRIATLVGRYYAMDRDKRWDRIEKAYRLLTDNEASFNATSALDGLKQAYARGETDEFVKPTLISGDADSKIQSGDSVIFMNFRADRARQMTQAFTTPSFSEFPTKPLKLSSFTTLTQYADSFTAPVAFPPKTPKNGIGEYLSKNNKSQLRISETEKYAHVTFFLGGGHESPFSGEERVLIPSPNVATYDLKPEMSAPEITEKLVEAIRNQTFDFIACNFANGDMVGHTGNFKAAVQAVEAVDTALNAVIQAILEVDGECIVTADHGNVEQMIDPVTGEPHTAHTCEKVPLLYISNQKRSLIDSHGSLADIAPTLLAAMDLPIPAEMTGKSLLATDTNKASI